MPPEYRTEPPEYRTEPQHDVRSGPAPYLAGSADHLAGPPEQTGAREYPAPPPDHLAAPLDHLAAPPPDHRAAPPRDRRSIPPRERRAALPPDGPAEPPEYQPVPPGYAAGPPDRQGRPPEYLAGSAEYPAAAPRPRTEHLADLPPAAEGAEPAGYGSAIYVGSRRRDASDPGIRGDAAYPHDTGGQVSYQPEPASDLYQGTGPLDYPGEPSMPHYPPGTSAPSRGDALGRSPADYPAHYGTAVTDDIGHEARRDSRRYGRPAGSRGVPSRHGDPDAPHA